MASVNVDWKARAEALARLTLDLLEVVEMGPCCGSGDEMTSHYHCPMCGEVGGMYIHDFGRGCPKPDPEYQKKQQLPELVRAACDEIIGEGNSSEKKE